MLAAGPSRILKDRGAPGVPATGVTLSQEKSRMLRMRVPTVARWAFALVLVAMVGIAAAASKKNVAAKPDEDPLHAQLENKSPQERIDYLQGVVDAGNATKETYFQLGNAQYEAGNAAKAADAFQQAVAADSTYFKAVINLGLMLDDQQLYPRAIETFEQAGRLQPNNPDVWSHMGNTYYAQKDFPKAMELYQKALKLDPKATHALYSMGVAFADAGMFREAVKYWDQVAVLDAQGELGKNAKENLELVKKYLIP
jgi:tetratricopeptide (TPR) repeat protein